VTNCQDTTILIPYSRQIRIHDCTNLSFIVHVASGPIIEGCKGIKFYQKDYRPTTDLSGGAINNDVHPAGMNLYWDVKDFHWLKNHVKSPNFDVFTEDALRQEKSLHDLIASLSNSVATMRNVKVTGEIEQVADSTERTNQEKNSDTIDNDNEEDSSEDEL
jgi:Tubulin binding cofactor C.